MPSRKQTTKKTRMGLYAASRYLSSDTKEELGIRIPVDVYIHDPSVSDMKEGFDKDFLIRWEPGITDGPTSARFAVVDFNNDTGQIAPPAEWNEVSDCFVDPQNYMLDRNNTDCLQYDQFHVWAILQRALEFFENGTGLGRPVPFGFEGNRLIVVPHAGYGQNAFYDRESKSLQFYYFDDDAGNRINTCLSTDIINHEFGHAVLDGVRPYYYESSLVETGAFHEFIGDLTAILLLLRNNTFRRRIAKETDGNLSKAKHLSNIAEQFGKAISGEEYLRSAKNKTKMSDITEEDGPHKISEVLTGAMYDILERTARGYIKDRRRSSSSAFWDATVRMKRMAIQPLDLLPPVDVTFRDYALAALRMEEISNPTDPFHYVDLMLDVFLKRGILTQDDVDEVKKPSYVFDRLNLDVMHSVDTISRSRSAAYRFLNDNRNRLLIPPFEDLIIADLYDSIKLTRQNLPLPRQIILEYIWREEITLEGAQFGIYEGEVTSMLCGGTLVFDETGNVLSWFRKPGLYQGYGEKWRDEVEAGQQRLDQFLSDLERQINAGRVGSIIGSGKGLLGSHLPPLTVQKQDGILHFALSPHMHLSGEDHNHYEGGPQWEVSS